MKPISNGKADWEGHSSDVIVDAFFRFFMQLRFRRRGESQIENVKKLLAVILEHHGEYFLKGVLMTVD